MVSSGRHRSQAGRQRRLCGIRPRDRSYRVLGVTTGHRRPTLHQPFVEPLALEFHFLDRQDALNTRCIPRP